MMVQGIVTACDDRYFPGLLALHDSVQTSHPLPLACYDLGLTSEQRSAASDVPGLALLDLPEAPLIERIRQATAGAPPVAKVGKRIWPLWICPLLIRLAPFDDVFWIDCDILVLRGLDELFDGLTDGPVFTPENLAPELCTNSPELYDLLPIHRKFDPAVPAVNAGVSGWRRDRDELALEAYARPVAAAATDPRIMDAIRWHDQGALIWAIQSLGIEGRVLSSWLWNLCVSHVRVQPEVLTWDAGLCERLRAALPEVRLLHWNGHAPPWTTP